MSRNLEDLRKEAIRFRDERDWAQFHTPKNLAGAIAVEAGELLEHFLWCTSEESKGLPSETRGRIAEEVADVQLFLFYMSEALQIDLADAVSAKLEVNAQRYPVEKSKGSAKKYTEL